jgi:hypothetical protein
MRIFLSWSGDRSKAAALGLKSLIEDTFPEAVDVFISDHIEAGETWARRLESELEESQFGVLCLTHDNFQAPWLLFEAGAISKRFGSGRVVPYLIDTLPEAAARSPLAQFQQVPASRDETFRLVMSINAARENPQARDRLERIFNRWWTDLEQTLKALPVPVGSPSNTRSDREVMETILQKVEILAQAHELRTGSHPNLKKAELAHLRNLSDDPTRMYILQGDVQKELRRLRDLGLIKNKQVPIANLPNSFRLSEYFELSEEGREEVVLAAARKDQRV